MLRNSSPALPGCRAAYDAHRVRSQVQSASTARGDAFGAQALLLVANHLRKKGPNEALPLYKTVPSAPNRRDHRQLHDWGSYLIMIIASALEV